MKTINKVIETGKCTGCAACANICPRKSIEMMQDMEGFYYPKISSNCVKCGLCLQVCPVSQPSFKEIDNNKSYAYYSEENSNAGRSSSSGVFEAIARYVINKKGVVCGAAFDTQWNVRHILVDNVDDLKLLCTSKYVQSYIEEDLYKRICKNLKERIVLFAGTPCQVAAINSFVKDRTNLITVDLVCHGVPSPKVWNSYLNNISCGKNILDVNFRDKSHKEYYGLKVVFKDSEYYESVTQSAYLQGYINNLYIRNSCTSCNFKGKHHVSDITLGDLWHAEKINVLFRDKHNISWVIVNTDVGAIVAKEIKNDFLVVEIDMQKEISFNQSYSNSSRHHKNRTRFFELYEQEEGELSSLINKYIKICFIERAFKKVKRLIQQKF